MHKNYPTNYLSLVSVPVQVIKMEPHKHASTHHVHLRFTKKASVDTAMKCAEQVPHVFEGADTPDMLSDVGNVM
jgi:hypothetical protein